MGKQQQVQFTIKLFEINRFYSSEIKKGIRKDRLHYQIEHKFDIDTKEGVFTVSFRITVVPSKQNNEELASIETTTSFTVIGIDPEDIVKLPDDVIVTFVSIAYSTTRGALAAKAQGSIVGEVPMPLIDPVDVVKSTRKATHSEN